MNSDILGKLPTTQAGRARHGALLRSNYAAAPRATRATGVTRSNRSPVRAQACPGTPIIRPIRQADPSGRSVNQIDEITDRAAGAAAAHDNIPVRDGDRRARSDPRTVERGMPSVMRH
jgi:hypothetical protein